VVAIPPPPPAPDTSFHSVPLYTFNEGEFALELSVHSCPVTGFVGSVEENDPPLAFDTSLALDIYFYIPLL
jgi:hypothetical protein